MKNIFDINDGDFIFSTHGNTGIDSDGDINIRLSEHTVMNLGTGDVHFTNGWKINDDDEDD